MYLKDATRRWPVLPRDSSRITQHPLVQASIIVPFYGLQSARVTSNEEGSILTNRWKLAALACVRNLGMMDPVYPKGKERRNGIEQWDAWRA